MASVVKKAEHQESVECPIRARMVFFKTETKPLVQKQSKSTEHEARGKMIEKRLVKSAKYEYRATRQY